MTIAGLRLTGVCKSEIIATNRPRHPWIPAYAGMTEWAGSKHLGAILYLSTPNLLSGLTIVTVQTSGDLLDQRHRRQGNLALSKAVSPPSAGIRPLNSEQLLTINCVSLKIKYIPLSGGIHAKTQRAKTASSATVAACVHPSAPVLVLIQSPLVVGHPEMGHVAAARLVGTLTADAPALSLPPQTDVNELYVK